MLWSLCAFLKAEDGPTAVEYAVMLALIIIVCIAAISALGSNASNTFSYVGSKVKGCAEVGIPALGDRPLPARILKFEHALYINSRSGGVWPLQRRINEVESA